jgi:RNA polymerase sigma-70 factor (ECF subfamily)
MDQAALVEALKSCEPAAFQGLVEAYGSRLLRSAFLLCGNETEAEDLVQDTFVEAIRSVHRFRGQASIYTWLHSILLNLTRHYHRDRKRIVYDDDLAAREENLPEDPLTGSDVQAASAELTEALGHLSAPHREVLVLRYYEQMKIHEIARCLGISKGTVKSRLHYAVREMQKRLPVELNLFGSGGTKNIETK